MILRRGAWLLAVSLCGLTQAQTVERVSLTSQGAEGNGSARRVLLSADGRYVAFASDADDLAAQDTNGVQDVFWHDRVTGETRLVSRATTGSSGNGSSGPRCPDCTDGLALSAGGRFVAFASDATDLVPGDTGGLRDIFVYDTQYQTLECVSRTSAGGQPNQNCLEPTISGDGNWVAFRSLADNIVSGDSNFKSDVFLVDRSQNRIRRVSEASGGIQANGGSFAPAISENGLWLAFESDAGNLVPGDTNSTVDIYVLEIGSGLMERVSVDSAEQQIFEDSVHPFLSADGRFVVFSSPSGALVAGDTNSALDVFLRDRWLGTTERVSLTDGGGEGNHVSRRGSVTADGRLVVFESWASNLVPGDTSNDRDIFLRDRFAGRTIQVSLVPNGAQANGSSFQPSLASSGRRIAFESQATNLDFNDTNGVADAFVVDRFQVSPEGVAATGQPFRFSIENANDEVGFFAQVLLSCTGTDGFTPADDPAFWIPLTFDSCTLIGLTYWPGLSGDIGPSGGLKTRTIPFPPAPVGLRLWAAAVTFDRSGNSYGSATPPYRFITQ